MGGRPPLQVGKGNGPGSVVSRRVQSGNRVCVCVGVQYALYRQLMHVQIVGVNAVSGCMFVESVVEPVVELVGRVTDCGVSGLGFKSPGSIFTSGTETSSLSRVVRDGGDPCSVSLIG